MTFFSFVEKRPLKSGVYFTLCPSESGLTTFHVHDCHTRPVVAAWPSSRESPGLYQVGEQCLFLRPLGTAQG